MYARINYEIAQSEIQLTITKTSPNKATLISVYPNKTIIDNAELMKEGEMVSISINTEDNTPLSAEMPASVILEIKHTEPGLKGNTATNATKPATLETGAIVNVPLFINEGDKIKVDTEKGNYIERIKIN